MSAHAHSCSPGDAAYAGRRGTLLFYIAVANKSDDDLMQVAVALITSGESVPVGGLADPHSVIWSAARDI